MAKLKRLAVVLAGCIIAGSFTMEASAQPRLDRDWDDGRDWQDRDWDRDRDWRDRGWERGRRWRDRDCYYETRRERNRFGELGIRRYRICEE